MSSLSRLQRLSSSKAVRVRGAREFPATSGKRDSKPSGYEQKNPLQNPLTGIPIGCRLTVMLSEVSLFMTTPQERRLRNAPILECIFQVEPEKRQRFLETLKVSSGDLPDLSLSLLQMYFRLIRANPDVGIILIPERQVSHIEELEFVYRFLFGVPRTLARLLHPPQERGEIRQVPSELTTLFFQGLQLPNQGSTYDRKRGNS